MNDFLPENQRKQDIYFPFSGNPSIKDVIEALNIPHPEIDLIIINGKSVDFSYKLKHGDRIAVYPVFESLDISPLIRLHPKPLRVTRFILDVQLGRLARDLRMLGFDTLYSNKYTNPDIVRIAAGEHRIILTRDLGVLKYKSITHGYWVRSTTRDEQLVEVVKRFDLSKQFQSFKRCLLCNGIIELIAKDKIKTQLLPKTLKYFNIFYRCPDCKKIYWEGSHFKRMQEKINQILELTSE